MQLKAELPICRARLTAAIAQKSTETLRLCRAGGPLRSGPARREKPEYLVHLFKTLESPSLKSKNHALKQGPETPLVETKTEVPLLD